MQLSSAELEKIAALSKLSLTDAEKETFGRQLTAVLDYVGMLANVDTEGVEPLAGSGMPAGPLRDDAPAPVSEAERAALLANFPETEGDLLKVKAVFS